MRLAAHLDSARHLNAATSCLSTRACSALASLLAMCPPHPRAHDGRTLYLPHVGLRCAATGR